MRVKLHFSMLGKTSGWSKTESSVSEWTNEHTFGCVRSLVASHFGDRALVIDNENLLKDDNITYPRFYSAGWFMDNEMTSELVVLAHGETMEEANRAMIDCIKSISWNEFSARI